MKIMNIAQICPNERKKILKLTQKVRTSIRMTKQDTKIVKYY